MTAPIAERQAPNAGQTLQDADYKPLDLYEQLLQQGTDAYKAGYHDRAHRIWKRAATVRPGDEQVWWLLLNVVQNEADQLVCCHNIVTINPDQHDLLLTLQPHYAATQQHQPADEKLLPLTSEVRRGINWVLMALEVIIVVAFVVAAIIIIIKI